MQQMFHIQHLKIVGMIRLFCPLWIRLLFRVIFVLAWSAEWLKSVWRLFMTSTKACMPPNICKYENKAILKKYVPIAVIPTSDVLLYFTLFGLQRNLRIRSATTHLEMLSIMADTEQRIQKRKATKVWISTCLLSHMNTNMNVCMWVIYTFLNYSSNCYE